RRIGDRDELAHPARPLRRLPPDRQSDPSGPAAGDAGAHRRPDLRDRRRPRPFAPHRAGGRGRHRPHRQRRSLRPRHELALQPARAGGGAAAGGASLDLLTKYLRTKTSWGTVAAKYYRTQTKYFRTAPKYFRTAPSWGTAATKYCRTKPKYCRTAPKYWRTEMRIWRAEMSVGLPPTSMDRF